MAKSAGKEERKRTGETAKKSQKVKGEIKLVAKVFKKGERVAEQEKTGVRIKGTKYRKKAGKRHEKAKQQQQ